jgi:hypothetical protein
VVVSLCGAHLLVSGWLAPGVSDSSQALAFELTEPDAVLGVRDVEVEHRPDERQAAGLAGEAPITLVRRLTSASERSSRLVTGMKGGRCRPCRGTVSAAEERPGW